MEGGLIMIYSQEILSESEEIIKDITLQRRLSQ